MEIKSVYKRGAEYGWSFGLYLSAIFMTLVYGSPTSLLSFFGLVLVLLIPFLLFFYLRHCYVVEGGTSTFSALWMLGILIFIYGSLVCGAVSYVWLQYVKPTFIHDQALLVLDMYKRIPEMSKSDVVRLLQTAIDGKLLPSPIEFVFEMIWLTTFAGSVLSIFEAMAVRMFDIKKITLKKK